MKNERLKHVVAQYRLAEEKLYAIREEHIKLEIAFEIFTDLEKELNKEIERARESNDSSTLQFWQDILDNYFRNDETWPDQKDREEAQKKVSENEKLIVYYERKLKILASLLGSREVELIESYDRKDILMKSQRSSGRLLEEVEKEEDLKREEDKKKKGFTFDKM